jgi:hypothetical protein
MAHYAKNFEEHPNSKEYRGDELPHRVVVEEGMTSGNPAAATGFQGAEGLRWKQF